MNRNKNLSPKTVISFVGLVSTIFLSFMLSTSLAQSPTTDNIRLPPRYERSPETQSVSPPTVESITDSYSEPAIWQQTRQTGQELVLKQSLNWQSQTEAPLIGDIITYTVIITNESHNRLTDMTIFDVLPRDALDTTTISCDGCQKITETVQQASDIFNPKKITVITATRQLRWNIPALSTQEAKTLTFSGRLVCKKDGDIIENNVFVGYTKNGEKLTVGNSKLNTIFAGQPSLGQFNMIGPTWCSTGAGFGLDADWGDFDFDGDLDLALATKAGTFVYRIEQGKLVEYWQDDRLATGVRWIEAIPGNGVLELLTVGTKVAAANANAGQGVNYLYQPSGTGFTEINRFFSDTPIWRVDTADYDGDGDLDLAATNFNVSRDSCAVRLYGNQGGGMFVNAGCPFPRAIGDENSYTEYPVWGDFDNDGDPDLAVTGSRIAIIRNNNHRLSAADTILLKDDKFIYGYDAAWGDYNQDGLLDLAAADFSNNVRIYPNQNGSLSAGTYITIPKIISAVAVDWADLDQDGALELIVASDAAGGVLYIYDYKNTVEAESSGYYTCAVEDGPNCFYRLAAYNLSNGAVLAAKSADADNDGDIDVVVVNNNSNLLFSNFGLLLDRELTYDFSKPASQNYKASANSVAWGDIDFDGDLDLLYGASSDIENGALGSALIEQKTTSGQSIGRQSNFRIKAEFPSLGPRDVAFGDVNNDGRLDLALSDRNQIDIYSADDTTTQLISLQSTNTNSLAWGDYNDDGNLDLLVGRNGTNAIYRGTGSGLETTPVWQSDTRYDSRSVAWGDFNRDRYLDFAVGNFDGPTQVYCNNQDDTLKNRFTLAWEHKRFGQGTTSVAWADFDMDGDIDLAVGNAVTNDLLIENPVCNDNNCPTSLPFQPNDVSCSDRISFTPTALPELEKIQLREVNLAWGDMDNDGDFDLAVGNYITQGVSFIPEYSSYGFPDFLYTINIDKNNLQLFDKNWIPSPNLNLLPFNPTWRDTTHVALGDYDQDGDLDLAISSEDKKNGIYENYYNNRARLLANNPPSVYIPRPGKTADGYFYSVGNDLLSGATNPTVTIRYVVNDPDRIVDDNGKVIAVGDGIVNTLFEYSVNGGSQWLPATPATTPTTAIPPNLLGQNLFFLWDAQADQAISDQAKFRITILPAPGPVSANDSASKYQIGTSHRGNLRAVSPPFRVRGLTCVWPQNPQLLQILEQGSTVPIQAAQVKLSGPVKFMGAVDKGSRDVTFLWEFSDGITKTGQIVQRSEPFTRNNREPIKLSVTSAACPIAKTVQAVNYLRVGTGQPDTHLPLLQRGRTSTQAGRSGTTEVAAPRATIPPPLTALPQIMGLSGEVNQAGTHLSWSPSAAGTVNVEGYHVYRLAQGQTAMFEQIATLPLAATGYTDSATQCGQMYYVTTFGEGRESDASLNSYFSPPCE